MDPGTPNADDGRRWAVALGRLQRLESQRQDVGKDNSVGQWSAGGSLRGGRQPPPPEVVQQVGATGHGAREHADGRLACDAELRVPAAEPSFRNGGTATAAAGTGGAGSASVDGQSVVEQLDGHGGWSTGDEAMEVGCLGKAGIMHKQWAFWVVKVNWQD